ncbi:NADP(H)-dependent aldo-keto reductase [Balneatrix alpica]|uniref:NADP(H)-dependent aldo-keto reductase n=1 Tax=Balneatrix alpica TaxID=75684 RepID=A0ABV5ZI38_9GAMM|nr:NADP(H)-dependent aldo-keto reductase [Balneatrix alpica]
MQYHPIPHSDLKVSKICLGTMTWGEQNSEAEAHQQLDYALAAGVNFIDTAEMYPVPPQQSTQGRTESYIGSWLAKTGKRADIVLATKVAGPADMVRYLRPQQQLDKRNIQLALEASLKRLQTDYIDLYQVHWPSRQTNFFGKLNYQATDEAEVTPILETLEALAEQVKAGKIRYLGLSNETPWGVMEYLRLAREYHLPRVISIQNPYNLLNRSFEVGLAEIAHREGVELLAYSPLAFGALSGKYLKGQWPQGARMTLYKRFARYFTEQGIAATEAYVALAQQHGLSPAQMALAYVNQRPFVAANIIGATSLEQLQENLGSLTLELSAELLEQLEALGRQYSNPCP